MFRLFATALLAAGLAGGAQAESTTMSAPIEAGSLHQGPLDMVAYWVPLEDQAHEVTATFVGRMPGDEPVRLVMRLDEGDDVAFAMPGYRSMLYRFVRHGDAVDVSVAPVRTRLTMN